MLLFLIIFGCACNPKQSLEEFISSNRKPIFIKCTCQAAEFDRNLKSSITYDCILISSNGNCYIEKNINILLPDTIK